MQGHNSQILDIVHLPGRRRIVVCSADGSLRLWDLESNAQIGDAWRDEGHKADVKNIALSPSGKTVASGSDGGTVRLWDVKTGRVIARWVGHTENVGSVCWSGDGERVVSGSWDGTARVWDVRTGKTVLEIKNGHQYVWAVTYSPDNTKFATGGENENAVKIWDANTGELLSTLHQDQSVRSLAWTSDGKKLFSGSLGPIGIFDTVTWKQITVLKGHIFNLSLARNDRLLASTSIWDETVCLWNLKTNLPVCPPFQHDKDVSCLAFSADGKLLVTACEDKNVYLWDIYAILKEVDLEDLLSIPDVVPGKSLINSDATPPAQSKNAGRVPLGFFDGMQLEGNIHSSTSRGVHHPSSTRRSNCALTPSMGISRILLDHLPLLFRPSHSPTSEAAELQQRSRLTIFSRRGPRTIEVAAIQDKQALYVAPRPEHEKAKYMQQQQSQSQSQAQVLSSQTQPTDASTPATPPATSSTTAGAVGARQPRISLWARIVLFLCCASPPDADGH